MKWFIVFYAVFSALCFVVFVVESCRDTYSLHSLLDNSDCKKSLKGKIGDYAVDILFSLGCAVLWPVGIFMFICLF